MKKDCKKSLSNEIGKGVVVDSFSLQITGTIHNPQRTNTAIIRNHSHQSKQ